MASGFPAPQIASRHLLQRPLWREWRFFLFLAMMLVPCFWQNRIQAGDLSSHLYNSWLALQIRSGAIGGLSIVPQWTNVAFDWVLTALLARFGPGPAQRLAVSLAVMIFAGGAFFFSAAVSGRRPWFLTPFIAVLAYGFVFHIGFFNFYLSLGICLWFLAVFWTGSLRRRALAAPLLALAWLAHPLPVIWAVGCAVYCAMAEALAVSNQVFLLGSGVIALLLVRLFIFLHYHAVWSPAQVFGIMGADQTFLFGFKYLIVMVGLLLLSLVWLRRLVKRGNGWRSRCRVAAQLFLLTAAGILILPSRIDAPRHYGHGLVYVADRMSLPAGILLSAVLARLRPRRAEIVALAALSLLFFAFLYADGAWENRQEDQVEALLEHEVPARARVVFFWPLPNSRLNPLAHVVDRECLGHCFSYGNYEPATRDFRIRAFPHNGIVATTYDDVYSLETGTYVVQPRDVPLYQIQPCRRGEQRLCVRQLQPGEINGQIKK